MEPRKYYAVSTKCGHVGRNRYIEITFPISATSKKEAAEVARAFPRVKHHAKDAIIFVNEIDKETYDNLYQLNHDDAYLACTNIQDQRMYCLNLDDRVHSTYEDDTWEIDKRRSRLKTAHLREKNNRFIEKQLYA